MGGERAVRSQPSDALFRKGPAKALHSAVALEQASRQRHLAYAGMIADRGASHRISVSNSASSIAVATRSSSHHSYPWGLRPFALAV